MSESGDPQPKEAETGIVSPVKPEARKKEAALNPIEQRLMLVVESRMMSVLRRETRDPYAGLPADDVLMRLDERFPGVHFPERMMSRLEGEQAHRHSRDGRMLEIQQYEAETDRIDAAEERGLQRSSGKRAERVLYVILAVGIFFVSTGHEGVGGVVVGTSLVAIIGAFLSQRFSRGEK